MKMLLFVVLTSVLAIGAHGVPLPERGLAIGRIVVSDHPAETEQFAASELQGYLARITGKAPIPIVSTPAVSGAPAQGTCDVLIGRPTSNALVAAACEAASIHMEDKTFGDDGYVIKAIHGGTTLLLTGPRDRSCLFAVYHFLELSGVRFFGYAAHKGEVIPHRDTIRVAGDLDVLEKPHMAFRFISDNGVGLDNRKKIIDIIDWGAKNRHNVMMLTPSRPGESWSQVPLDELKKRGMMIAGPGHALPQFTPPQELFATHPEYFPLIKGKRTTTFSAAWGGSTGFCRSNPEAMHIVVANVVKYLDANPFIDLLAIYPADGPQLGSLCHCDLCQARTTGDWQVVLLNAIDEAVQAKHPGVKLMWLAYNECGVPPAHMAPYLKGKDYVLVWCNDIRDLHEPMDSDANRTASPELQWDPALKKVKTDWMKSPGEKDLAAFYRWQAWADYLRKEKFEGQSVVLDYYNGHVAKSLKLHWLDYCQSGPWPNGVMQKDFQWYTAQGIGGWQNCTDYFNDHPNPYWNRLAAQLMWNPAADVSAIDDDFYAAWYGSAAHPMQEYFTAMWHELSETRVYPDGADRIALLTPRLIEAEKIAEKSGDVELSARIKLAREFHERCVAIRKELPQHYNADGSPRKL